MPGLGTLSINPGRAEADFLNTVIKAPSPRIAFDSKENDAQNLLDFIAANTNRNIVETIEKLDSFCNGLKAATIANNPAFVEGLGNFFTDSSGKINFTSIQLPAAYLQPVKAERVIHPQAEHAILVGDKETTNTVMNEYFSEEMPVKKKRWWIGAIVLAVLALLSILFYLNNNAALTAMAGNAMPI